MTKKAETPKNDEPTTTTAKKENTAPERTVRQMTEIGSVGRVPFDAVQRHPVNHDIVYVRHDAPTYEEVGVQVRRGPNHLEVDRWSVDASTLEEYVGGDTHEYARFV